MRKLRLLSLLAPVLLLPAACEDSSSSSGGTFNPEGGTSFEAGPLPEAGPPAEAGADVVTTPKGVTVTVFDSLAPKKDARVIAHDATGAVVGDVKTDATGKASFATAPSMVTVLTQYGEALGARFQPLTVAGVVDGENLVIDVTDVNGASAPDAGNYSVTFAGAPVVGATDYAARIGNCSNSTVNPALPLTVALTADCLGAQNAVLVSARNGAGDLAYGYAKNVAKPANATATVNVAPNAFVAAGKTKLVATNVPANGSSFGDLYAIANGMSFYTNSIGGAFEDGGLSFATATGFADAYQATATTRNYENGGTHAQIFVRREATTAPADTTLPAFDFATSLPSITNATLAKATVARPDVTITSSASLASADGAVAVVGWFFPAQEQSGRWTFVLPPSTTAFKVPALPADVPAQFVPDATSDVYEITFVESSQIPGYKELKALPVLQAGLSLADASRPLPAAGTVRLTQWMPGD